MKKIIYFLFISSFLVSCSKQSEDKIEGTSERGGSFQKKTGLSVGTNFTLRSLTTISSAVEMDVTVTSSSLLTVTTSATTLQPTDYYKIHYRDVTPSSFSISIPNDGLDYWFVPFNASNTPSKLTNNETIEVSCECSDGGTGKCEPKINVSTGEMWCDPATVDGCSSGCCNTIYTNTGGSGGSGGGLIIQMDKVKFNGVTYD